MSDRPRRLTELPPAMESAWSPIPKRGTKQAVLGGERMLCDPPVCRWCAVMCPVDADGLRRHLADPPVHRRLWND